MDTALPAVAADPVQVAADAARGDPTLSDTHAHGALSGMERPSLAVKLVNLSAVLGPFLGLLAAGVALWGWGLTPLHLTIFVVMYAITAVGITVGYHRLFTHKSFDANPAVKWTLGIFGSMAVEGPITRWVANHRSHHQHSDHEGDPHSPHHGHGEGLKAMLKGMWHAHVGWVFEPDRPGLSRYIPDLMKDRSVRIVSDLFPLWVVVSLLLPAVAGGLIGGSWRDALLGFLWGGLARVFFVHHVTWSINSVCHIWGTRPFVSHDESRNNVIFGVLGLGEGWHNNHHAFPTSARHGLRWWEFDASYWIIRGLELVGLARNVRVPDAQRLASKRAKPAA